MKKLISALLLATTFFALTGCKKDKAPEKTNQEKIIGNWKMVSLDYEVTRPGQPTEKESEPAVQGDYFDFRADGKLFYVFSGSRERSTVYTIENDKLKIEGEEFTIKELTNNKLAFEQVSVTSTRTTRETYNFTK